MEGRQRSEVADVCGRSAWHMVQISGWRAKTQRNQTVANSACFLDSLFKEGATHVDAKEPVNKLDVAEHHVCKQSCDMFWLLVSNPASDLCKQSRRVVGRGRRRR